MRRVAYRLPGRSCLGVYARGATTAPISMQLSSSRSWADRGAGNPATASGRKRKNPDGVRTGTLHFTVVATSTSGRFGASRFSAPNGTTTVPS